MALYDQTTGHHSWSNVVCYSHFHGKCKFEHPSSHEHDILCLADVVLSHCHTGSYDCLIVRSVAIWRTCDRSAMFATIASSDRILRSVFLLGGRSSNDWSYGWSRDQQRLEKIVRLVVAINDRSYDRSWPPTIDRMINSVGRRMGSELNPRNISTLYSVSEQPIGGTTGRKVARPVARLIVRPLTI